MQVFAQFFRDKVSFSPFNGERKNLIATIVLLLLVVSLPVGINLVQRIQTYFSQAAGETIELIDGECVVDIQTHKLKCATVPLKLTSPYGPKIVPSPSASATASASISPSPSPSLTASASPSVSPTASPTSCVPRPAMGRNAQMTADGMVINVTAGTNTNTPVNKLVSKIDFKVVTNAVVIIDGNIYTQPFVLSIPTGGRDSVQILVKQATYGQSTTVEFDAEDNCGIYTLTFGGGPNSGWPTPVPSPVACNPRPNIGRSAIMVNNGLSVVLTAATNSSTPTNPISQIKFTSLTNAKVLIGNTVHTQVFDFPYTSPVNQADFVIQQVVTGQPTTVQIKAVDSCGEYPLMFGGGAEQNWPSITTMNPATGGFLSSFKNWLIYGFWPKAVYAQSSCVDTDLVQNGSFEEPTLVNPHTNNGWILYGVSPETAAAQPNVSTTSAILGWKPRPATAPYQVEVHRNLYGSGAKGAQYSEIDIKDIQALSQRFSTVAGRKYDLKFAYAPRPGITTEQKMGVYWNGGLVDTITKTATSSATASALPWQYHTYILTAASESADLSFGSVLNNGSGNFLDDVSLKAVCPSGPACGDSLDNDSDQAADIADSMCHSDGDPSNVASYLPQDENEGFDRYTQCSDSIDNDGDGKIDGGDSKCKNAGGQFDPALPSEFDGDEGTVAFRLAESEAGLASAEESEYVDHPVIVNYTLSDPNPGAKQIWVQFKNTDGQWSSPDHISIEVTEPSPQISGVSCNLDINKSNLKVTMKGKSFGSGTGKIQANGTDLQILEWTPTEVSGLLKTPEVSLEDGAEFSIGLIKADGTVLRSETCQVNTTLISLGAQVFCRDYGKLSVADVKVTIVDETGAKAEEVVNIDQNGVIKGLKTRLQSGKRYSFSIKAPHAIRRTAVVTIQEGTSVVTAPNGRPFILPIGDISPRNTLDGKINTADRSELIRQWRVLGNDTVTLTGDFNQDKRVNSIDWACMRYDFNAEDDAIPASVPVETPTPSQTPVPSRSSAPSVSPSPSPETSPLTAKLKMFTDKNSLAVNETFTLYIAIRSDTDAVNLVASIIQFTSDKLEVVSIDKSESFANSWTEEFYDNSTGEISVVGGIPSPGYRTVGTDGVFVKVLMKAKTAGTGLINFVNGSQIYRNSDSKEVLDFSAQGVTLTVH